MNFSVIFLGIADFVEESDQRYPIGGIDLFQLSLHKAHIIYPGIISSNKWVILTSNEFMANCDFSKWEIHIYDDNNNLFSCISFSKHEEKNISEDTLDGLEKKDVVDFYQGYGDNLFYFSIGETISRPGIYKLKSIYDGISEDIGQMQFHYEKSPSLTADQFAAIESDPNSAKYIRIVLGCKFCDSKLHVYTGIRRSSGIEKDGGIWHTDAPDFFKCKCEKTIYSLEYIKESMHWMLTKDFNSNLSHLSYVRRYGHAEVSRVVNGLMSLLSSESYEEPFQKYIENNPILLSRFHAKRLFVKPNIIGKFVTDFVIVDSLNRLIFIELERPSMKLFKKDGHPTADLMHAYGQVNDWLYEYSKYSGAILDQLKLRQNEVVAVKGAVIAGRGSSVSHNVLQRHLSNPPYQNVDFMTIDDLGTSLMAISQKLA